MKKSPCMKLDTKRQKYKSKKQTNTQKQVKHCQGRLALEYSCDVFFCLLEFFVAPYKKPSVTTVVSTMGTLVGTFYSVMGTPFTEDGWTQSHFN